MTPPQEIDINDPLLKDEPIEIVTAHDDEIPCEFLCGIAGTGKTYTLRKRIEDNPGYGYLCATTGISAINLNTITINSLLRYFNTDSLQASFESGFLHKTLRDLAQRKRNLVVDEVSMMSADQLDIIYQAVSDVNEYRTVDKPFGIVLCADFAQLPPINEPWAFTADCWPNFERNTTKLTKNWRQGDGRFLDALNALRRGDGGAGVGILQSLGVEFAETGDRDFDGTTIRATNEAVDRFNFLVHRKLKGDMISVRSRRWGTNPNGKTPSEWRQIPEKLELKIGAYVMILANSGTFPIDVLYCRSCGARLGTHEESLQILQEKVHGSVDNKRRLQREKGQNPESSPVLHGELFVEMGAKTVSSVVQGNDQTESGERPEENREDAQSHRRVHSDIPAQPSKSDEKRTPDGAQSNHGESLGPLPEKGRNRTSQERNSGGQPPQKPSSSYLGNTPRQRSVSVLSKGLRNPVVTCPQCNSHKTPTVKEESSFTHGNGDCGHILDYDDLDETFTVELVRNKQTVQIGMIDRKITSRDAPPTGFLSFGKKPFKGDKGIWVYGAISYFPLRLAYACTVHKTQGLSLDRIQVNSTEGFFGQPSMAYVALSRARSVDGVRIVGKPEHFAKKVTVSPEVLRWL